MATAGESGLAAGEIDGHWELTIGAAVTITAILEPGQYALYATSACYIAKKTTDAAPSVATSGKGVGYMAAGSVRNVRIGAGSTAVYIACQRATANGTLYIDKVG